MKQVLQRRATNDGRRLPACGRDERPHRFVVSRLGTTFAIENKSCIDTDNQYALGGNRSLQMFESIQNSIEGEPPVSITSKIRVLLADDHQEMLARVYHELGIEFEIVATASNGSEAVDSVARFDPDVLVMDISMPILDGLRAASQLREAKSRAKIVFLTIHEDPDFVAAAFSAGASGYVTKGRLSTELPTAIREAFEGRTYICPGVRR